MGSCRIVYFCEDIQPSIMLNSELEKGKECFVNPFESGVSTYRFVDIPFRCRSHEGPLKDSQ